MTSEGEKRIFVLASRQEFTVVAAYLLNKIDEECLDCLKKDMQRFYTVTHSSLNIESLTCKLRNSRNIKHKRPCELVTVEF